MRAVEVPVGPPVPCAPGPAPMLQWVEVAALRMDDAYQRPLTAASWKAIRRIAENFQWSRFSPVLLAPLEAGLFAVIDGQHRAHAAAMAGIASVPAQIVQVGQAEQGRAFVWVNGQNLRVNAWQIHKAKLAAGDEAAVRADRAVTAAGCRLMTGNQSSSLKKPGDVYALGLIQRLVAADADAAITAGLAALRAVPDLQRPVCWTDFLLAPWLEAVRVTGCTDTGVLVAVLAAENPFKVVERAHAAISATSRMVRARGAFAARIEGASLRMEVAQ